ncbi:MAG TPA: hypothetical protein DEF88_14710 [Porphyromonadaceae bacterium]|nr:hypothetical protein [Porphyromonadaceae bacterium]HCM21212.1 hypothetical protein [Porphyromonadaceae bacterium]
MNKLITVMISLLATLFFVISCDDMNDIQREYAEQEEQVYLGKVDSLQSFPGFGRTKITWYIGSDPKIERTIIYWNMRNDSIVKDFIRTTPGLQRDSVIIENLPEGTTHFEFRNVNNKGETSLYSSVSAVVWGEDFADGLRARKIVSRDFDYEQSRYKLSLSPATRGDSVVYSQIVYKDSKGVEKTVRVERESNAVELPDFTGGQEFQFRTVFFLPEGIDTVYNNYENYKSPTAVFDNGEKLSLQGHIGSRYFERNGKSLYEWNAAGDLIVYTLEEDGSFTYTEKYVGVVPRNVYRDFFFYDDDKFIAISTDHKVTMHQIVNGKLVSVGSTFGTGFSMEKFIPARGFFYSLAGGTLKTWFAKNDGTLNGSLGGTVATDFIYAPSMLFNFQHLVGVDKDGYLYSIPITTIGSLGSKNRIGSGWNRFKQIINVGPKLLGLDSNGDFYEFDFDATNSYWVLDK